MNMNDWQNIIENALKRDLPGVKSHRKMLPSGREVPATDINDPDVISSGILVVIFPEGNELYTCLIKRQPNLKHHPGQIGFPGGKMEQSDDNPRAAALRETSEEIGIQPDKALTIGALSPLYVQVSGFLIYPFVAWIPSKPKFLINPEEVDKILLFPLLDYLNNRKTTQIILETATGPLRAPSIFFKGETIWGATAMILTEFLDILEGYFTSGCKQ